MTGYVKYNDGIYYGGTILNTNTAYYENVYRSITKTSQYLPWEQYILDLKEGYNILVTTSTLIFIATYDYGLDYSLIADQSDLELCQTILSAIRNLD
jgi:hypothetical protein